MAQKSRVKKRYLKTWAIQNYYIYHIFEVDGGGLKWLEAVPITKGATRCADTETELKIMLDNDAINMTNFWSKVR